MFKYSKESLPGILLHLCNLVGTYTVHQSISKSAAVYDVSISTLRQAAKADTEEKANRHSLDGLAGMLHKLPGAPSVYVSVNGKAYFLNGASNQELRDLAHDTYVRIRNKHYLLSREELADQLGLSLSKLSYLNQRNFGRMRTSTILDMLQGMFCDIEIGIVEEGDDTNISPLVQNITESMTPVSDMTHSIRQISRRYFLARRMTIEDVVIRSGQDISYVSGFLTESTATRLPMSIAIPIARACGATVSISIT